MKRKTTDVTILQELLDDYDLYQVSFVRILGLSHGIMGTWTSRGVPDHAISLISNTFFWSRDYLHGDSPVLWRHDIENARQILRSFASTHRFDTVRDAIIAVWSELQKFLPIKEEAWVVLTRMAKSISGRSDDLDMAVWRLLKSNRYFIPPNSHLENISNFTGIPLHWWIDHIGSLAK